MKIQLAVAGLGASIDKDSGSISVFSIIERIKADAFPVLIPEVSAIYTVLKEDGDPDEINLRLKGTVGQREIYNSVFSPKFAGKDTINIRLNIKGVSIPGEGILSFSIYKLPEEEKLGEYSVKVSTKRAPTTEITS